MGLGNFRWRILLIIVSALLLWQSSKVWLSFAQEKSLIEAQLQDNQPVTLNQKDEGTSQKVHVVVYYEALCPDSRSFFVKQLLPTYQKISRNIRVELIPYGKATLYSTRMRHVQILKAIHQVRTFLQTTETEDGYKFMCQHGPPECEANIIHACSINIIKNSSVQLEYITCMIKNNIKPVNIMKTCAEKMNLDYNTILKCSTGDKGKELLAKYGELTNSLSPRVSFIPTVVLDDSSENQARVLKNLLQEVCLHLKVLPEGCTL